MMRRRQCREQLFKLLFQVEFNDKTEYEELARRFRTFDDREELEESDEPSVLYLEDLDKEEKPPILTEEESDYVEQKFAAITGRMDEMDAVFNSLSPDWTTDRMGKVELAILRLAYYEMKYDDDIPESVAINEAVELAKKYGQDESYSFVNGILASCAEDSGKKKTEKKEPKEVSLKGETEALKNAKERPWKKNNNKARIVVKKTTTGKK